MNSGVYYGSSESKTPCNGKQFIVKFDTEVLPDVNNYRTHQIVKVDLLTTEDG